MILAATDWLSISISLLLIVFVIICLLMTLMILMQRPKQEGLGAAFGGGMTDQMFGARTTNVLQRATVWCASLFFLIALTLAVLIGKKNGRIESLVVKEAPEIAVITPVEEPESVEQTVESPSNLLDDPAQTEEQVDSGDESTTSATATEDVDAEEEPQATGDDSTVDEPPNSEAIAE